MSSAAKRRTRNTKIIATLGPASSNGAQIRRLYQAGADVFRLNFSHGSHNEHQERYLAIRALERELGRPIAILLDLQGPKLRLGSFADGALALAEGQPFRFDLDSAPGDARRAPLPHPEIFAALKPGDELLVDDGRIRFRISACGPDFADVTAMNAGTISNRKGVNVPDAVLPMRSWTASSARPNAMRWPRAARPPSTPGADAMPPPPSAPPCTPWRRCCRWRPLWLTQRPAPPRCGLRTNGRMRPS